MPSDHPTAAFGRFELLRRLAPGRFHMCRGGDAGNRYIVTRHLFDDQSDEGREQGLASAEAAVALMRCLSHPHVFAIVDAIRERSGVALVFDPIPSGLLMKRVYQGVARRLVPLEARNLFRQVLFTLKYAHERGIAHGSLGPRHLLLTDASTVRVFGLGMADLPPEVPITDATEGNGAAAAAVEETDDDRVLALYDFTPPEVRVSGKTPSTHAARVAADCWALGAMLYAMVKGTNFSPDNAPLIDAMQLSVSSLAASEDEVLKALLVTNPHARPSLAEVAKLPWVLGSDDFTSRRQSQQLIESADASICEYLLMYDSEPLDGIEQAATTLLESARSGNKDAVVLRRQDLTLRFFGVIGDCVRALEQKLGCHTFGDAAIEQEVKDGGEKPRIAGGEAPDRFTFEAVRMAGTTLVHVRVVVSIADSQAQQMDSMSSAKSMWVVQLEPIRGTEAAVAGLLSDFRRNLPGAVSVDMSLL